MHNSGTLFDLAAQQKANDLNSLGDNVIACRISSADDMTLALTGHMQAEGLNGQITGIVAYFGHSGPFTVKINGVVVGQISILAVGQNPPDSFIPRPNVDSKTVSLLSQVRSAFTLPNGQLGNILSNNTSLWINGCWAGVDVPDYYSNTQTSIAQLVANNIQHGVYAFLVPMYFSQTDADNDQYYNRTDKPPASLPMYMVQVGARHHKLPPTGFTPQ